jgi:hypothetical protein
MSDGRLGVGVETQERASLDGSGFVPMWPYMERDLSATLTTFTRAWPRLDQGDVQTPQALLLRTVETAWRSGRSYWMHLAALWALDMVGREGFDQPVLRGLLSDMAASDDLPPEWGTSGHRSPGTG